MLWIAPTEKDADSAALERCLWATGEAVSDEDFKEQLETLTAAARKLETTIACNVAEILET